jgi:hypothetical protein
MRQLMVRYQVKPERVDENEKLVGAVFESLHELEPGGFGYACFRLDDGVTFVHLVNETGEDEFGLTDVPAFQRFLEGLGDRVVEGPVATEMTPVASYRFFD